MKAIGVSDHAIVRWLERVYGVNLDELRAHISAPCRDAMDAGATSLSRPEGTYVLNPGARTVVTILAPGMREDLWQTLHNRARHRRVGGRRPQREMCEE